jgi:hypothetical protein
MNVDCIAINTCINNIPKKVGSYKDSTSSEGLILYRFNDSCFKYIKKKLDDNKESISINLPSN